MSTEKRQAEPKPAGAPEPKLKETSEPKPAGAPEPKLEETSEPKPAGGSEPKLEEASEPKPAGAPEPKLKETSEPKQAGVPEPKLEEASGPKPAGVPEPKLEEASELKPAGGPEPKLEEASEPKTAGAPEPKLEETSEPKPAGGPEPKLEETSEPKPPESEMFERQLLKAGFYIGLIMAVGCLVAALTYFFNFQSSLSLNAVGLERYLDPQTPELKSLVVANINMSMMRLGLVSCGMFTAMALAFLGFSLFLLGISGEMDVSAKSEAGSVKIARMSPGVLMIICAVALLSICVHQKYTFQMQLPRASTDTSDKEKTVSKKELEDQIQSLINRDENL